MEYKGRCSKCDAKMYNEGDIKLSTTGYYCKACEKWYCTNCYRPGNILESCNNCIDDFKSVLVCEKPKSLEETLAMFGAVIDLHKKVGGML